MSADNQQGRLEREVLKVSISNIVVPFDGAMNYTRRENNLERYRLEHPENIDEISRIRREFRKRENLVVLTNAIATAMYIAGIAYVINNF